MRLEADHLAVHQQVAEKVTAATAAGVIVAADVWTTDAFAEAQKHADGQSRLLLLAAVVHCWAADGHLRGSLQHLRGSLKHLGEILKHLRGSMKQDDTDGGCCCCSCIKMSPLPLWDCRTGC